jgi:hypothetical protein
MATLGKWPWLAVMGLVLFGGGVLAGDAGVTERLRKDITFLASDECEGRGVTTKGIELAADYIANQFKLAGLKPGGVDGTYFQPFNINQGKARIDRPCVLALEGLSEKGLTWGEDFQALGLSGSGTVKAPVVFAGYGIQAKEIGYDDYQGIDVKNKVVVLIRKTPHADGKPVSLRNADYHAALLTKVDVAEKRHAAGVIFVNDSTTPDQLEKFDTLASETASAHIPVLHVRRAVVDAMLQTTLKTDLSKLEDEIGRELKPRSADLPGFMANIEVHVERKAVVAKNIIGILEGSGPLAEETVYVGAHYDHLGYGGFGSMAKNKTAKQIHHGADDNASGSTSVMELARHFAGQPRLDSCRRMVFMTFSGEEMGLLGSQYYGGHPLLPWASTVAMLNLDMVGRLRKEKSDDKDMLLVEGAYSSPEFMHLLDGWNKKYNFSMHRGKNIPGNSDHYPFYLRGVPVLFYWNSFHDDYHRPSDTSDKINIAGMEKIINLAEDTLDYFRTVPERPKFVKVQSDSGKRVAMNGPRLGIQPGYANEKEGVLLDGVGDNTPASKAGFKAGDRIVEMDSKPIRNLENYMLFMNGRKKGDSFDVIVLRGDKRVTLQVKLN